MLYSVVLELCANYGLSLISVINEKNLHKSLTYLYRRDI